MIRKARYFMLPAAKYNIWVLTRSIYLQHCGFYGSGSHQWFCKRPNTPLYYFVMPENQQAKDFFWQAGCLKSRSLMSAKCANIKTNTIWRHFTSFLVFHTGLKYEIRCNLTKPLHHKKFQKPSILDIAQ